MKKNKNKKYILGLESSCDESAAAIIEFDSSNKFKVLSSIISSQINIHQKYGGVVPEIAAREHVATILPVIDEALEKANISIKDLTAIAVTSGPGLITSLLSASETAKAISFIHKIPIIDINHIEGHVYSAFLEEEKIKFPAIILTVSGGHNILAQMTNHLKYKIIGQTLDDAAGEAFDKASKMMGLGYPGGPIISKLSKEYILSNKKRDSSETNTELEEIDLPRPMLFSPNFNFSFSGLKTALLYKLQKDSNWKKNIPKYCYSFEKAVIDILIHKTIKAIKKYPSKTILLVGGVSANSALKDGFQEKLKNEASLKSIKFISPSLKYTGDNATMIALAGIYHFKKNKKNLKNWKNLKISSNLSFK